MSTLGGDQGRFSTEARQRMESDPWEPMFLADWLDVLMVHFQVEAGALQRIVPFELDLRAGRAYVSLVSFHMAGMRPRFGGEPCRWLLKPIASHPFLNVRTYVRRGEETGIYFLAEWLPNRLSVALGPRLFGLPYRAGTIERMATSATRTNILVKDSKSGDTLECGFENDSSHPLHMCDSGSLDEWLMERYTAFTCNGNKSRFFRVWHQPWQQRPADVHMIDQSLLESNWPFFKNSPCLGANWSPGVQGVWMGRPRRIRHAVPARQL
jgi:uncharacterized protein YqjF (DUF2071 family)